MRNGDIVIIRDGSYSVKIRNRKIVKTGNIVAGKPEFCVIATNCVLPIEGLPPEGTHNNIILQECKTGIVVFTQEKYCCLAKNYCSRCGQKIYH